MNRVRKSVWGRGRRGAVAAAVAMAAGAAVLGVSGAAQAADVEITPAASAVTASSNDGDVPGNVVDGDYSTRWSGQGDGAWLQLDLGTVHTVTHIKLAVYQGDSRENVFQLQYWDGSAWQTAYNGRSSGTSTALESFTFPAVQTSRVRYVGDGYVLDSDGTAGTWNSLTEVEVWGGAATGGGGGGGTATVPGQVLDLTNWKETLPTGPSEDPTEIGQPQLATYDDDPYFTVAPGGTAVQFRAGVNGVTTSGSGYPRSELREMTNNGADEASWSATSGTSTLTVKEAFTHLPNTKPQVVGAQIHNASDDVSVFRLEGTDLYVTDGDDTHHKLVTSSYQLGTPYQAEFVVSGGTIKAYYNGTLETTIAYTGSGNYFKTGAYVQANCTNSSPCSASNYGEVDIYDATVSHT
ncbi:polysaccharide lyase family 7 protein [Streptomyces sp. SL13]|uniref:Polysaccharide lyase family 7 protein n=1 Tax=Streptantibioticus silvisoli TaxID=2705255 RepID=A0AA90H4V3_9ACTN|nr:polysaccharide lyase family 7 protein [Streptantibioticus silvisoli]MDI5971003.1 polysaccharide lyase family 7 protein [Streptantibioticus silvisoli]